MKKINMLASLLMGLTILSACSTDRDGNPTMEDPTTFVLNKPAFADGAVYDLKNSSDVELTCSQPNYGFTAATIYSVQVSVVDTTFTDSTKYVTLSTTYSTAKMDVDAKEIAAAASQLLLNKGSMESDFPVVCPMYIRLKAGLTNGSGIIYSNAVTLKNVRVNFALPAVTLPTELHILGSGTSLGAWSWDKCLDMVQTYAQNGTFWRIVYCDANSEFKVNTAKSWNGNQVGAGATLVDNAGAGLSGTDNVVVANAGWYLMMVKTAISGRKVLYTIDFEKPNVYLFGVAAALTDGGDAVWADNDANLFVVPTTADGYFESKAFTNAVAGDSDGGVRMCVTIPGEDWWHAEFVVIKKVITYRGTGGDQTRVGASKGQKVYLNFSTGEGYIK
jgi:hypothetical protein